MKNIIVVVFFMICISCKSQKNTVNHKIFNEEVKKELLHMVSTYPGDYYLTHYYLDDKDVYVVELNKCGDCYFKPLINKSHKLLNLENGFNIKIVKKEDIRNFKTPENEVYVILTGGSYVIVLDNSFNIIEKYSSG